MALTQDRLKELLQYDSTTGVFRRVDNGRIAGTINADGGRSIMLDCRLYTANRLAFLYMTGSFPTLLVDHRDGDRGNDQWNNLRLANRSQNAMNKKREGQYLKGCTKRRSGRFQAQIFVDGKKRNLGTFDSETEAHQAYCTAAQEAFGEFFRAS